MTRQLRTARTRGASPVAASAAIRGQGGKALLRPRAFARAIDAALIGVPAVLIGSLLGKTVDVGFVVAVLLAAYLYETIGVARAGATMGKALMGLHVVDAATGERPTVSRAGTRFLLVAAVAGAIHLIVPVGPAAAVFLWGSAVAADDGRGLPDTVAGTVVVRRR